MRVQRGGILMKFWRKKSIFEDSLFWEIFFYLDDLLYKTRSCWVDVLEWVKLRFQRRLEGSIFGLERYYSLLNDYFETSLLTHFYFSKSNIFLQNRAIFILFQFSNDYSIVITFYRVYQIIFPLICFYRRTWRKKKQIFKDSTV